MKKFCFLTALLCCVFAFTSCTKDENTDEGNTGGGEVVLLPKKV